MPWTPLHASLGEATEALEFALIERACVEGVPERTDLDWKQQLPLTAPKSEPAAKQAQQSELAKDIAAMANSGGGMIVYGVKEAKGAGTSAAEAVVPVGVVDEDVTRDIRRVAGNLVYPPVVGLDLLPLAPEGRATDGVLVMLVPDSVDRPHLVHPTNGRDLFGGPYRHGPDTAWMVERQLAAAYSERETGRRRRVEEFQSRYDEFTWSLFHRDDLRWVVALAVPEQAHPRPRNLTQVRARRIIDRAWGSGLTSDLGPADLTGSAATERGLRRFIRNGSRTMGPLGGSDPIAPPARARVEVHGDGAVAVAFTRAGAIPEAGWQQTHVTTSDIEATARDFLALLLSVRDALRMTGDYTARLTVHPATEIFRRPEGGYILPWHETDRVYGYRPVDGAIVGTAGRDALISSWVDLVSDAVNQAGAPCRLDATDLATTLWAEE